MTYKPTGRPPGRPRKIIAAEPVSEVEPVIARSLAGRPRNRRPALSASSPMPAYEAQDATLPAVGMRRKARARRMTVQPNRI